MKLILSLLFLVSFSALAETQVHSLVCKLRNQERNLYVSTVITDRDNYLVYFADENMIPKPVYYAQITFKEDDSVLDIGLTSSIESVWITRYETHWSGEYWYDNSPSVIDCYDMAVEEKKIQEEKHYFICEGPNGTKIYVDVLIQDPKNYQVSLKDAHLEPMEILGSEILFDETKNMKSLSTHGLIDAFWMEKSEGKWSGGYSYDLWQTTLACLEI